MKIIYILCLVGFVFNTFASKCDDSYDKYGCYEVVFDLGAGMKINQFRVIYDGDQDGVADKKDKCLETPSKVEVDRDGCEIKKEVVEVKIVNLKLNFATSKYEILDDYFNIVSEFAQFMIKNPQFNAKIVGHTDSRDKLKKNKILSENRANAVVEMLISLGVDKSRLSSEGVASEQPVATNTTPEGRAKNRRIKAIVSKEVK